MSKNQGFTVIEVLIVIAIAVLVLAWPVLTALYVYGTQQERTFTVNKMERVASDKSSKYLVFTDQGVLENTDSFFRWKFNSSDVYNQLQPGKRYTCDTYGWRLQFGSVYPNIVSCRESKQ